MALRKGLNKDFESDRVLLQHSISKAVKGFYDKWGLDNISVSVITVKGSFLMTDDGKGHTGPSFACDVEVDNEAYGVDDYDEEDE